MDRPGMDATLFVDLSPTNVIRRLAPSESDDPQGLVERRIRQLACRPLPHLNRSSQLQVFTPGALVARKFVHANQNPV